jgi:hypothetical protein
MLVGTQLDAPPVVAPPKEMNRKLIAVGIAMALAGCFMGLVGLLIFFNRAALASTFLGANIMFGMPWAEADAQKVALVALGGLAAIGLGGVGFLLGALLALIQFARSR